MFNESMYEFNVTSLNSSDLDIYIAPTLNKDDDRNISLLNFTWKAIDFKKNVLKIKANFSNEVLLSPYAKQDLMVVHFNDSKLFRSRIANSLIH